MNPIREVIINGHVVLEIAKHCNDSLPKRAAGSLFGEEVGGVVEIIRSDTVLCERADLDAAYDGECNLGSADRPQEHHALRNGSCEVSCAGWYESITFGSEDTVNFQYDFPAFSKIADNSIIVLYDPILARNGSLVLKAFRFTELFLELKHDEASRYIDPSKILEEVPVHITDIGNMSAYLRCLQADNKNKLCHVADEACVVISDVTNVSRDPTALEQMSDTSIHTDQLPISAQMVSYCIQLIMHVWFENSSIRWERDFGPPTALQMEKISNFNAQARALTGVDDLCAGYAERLLVHRFQCAWDFLLSYPGATLYHHRYNLPAGSGPEELIIFVDGLRDRLADAADTFVGAAGGGSAADGSPVVDLGVVSCVPLHMFPELVATTDVSLVRELLAQGDGVNGTHYFITERLGGAATDRYLRRFL